MGKRLPHWDLNKSRLGVGVAPRNDGGNWVGLKTMTEAPKDLFMIEERLKVGGGDNGGGREGSIAVGMNFMGLGLYRRNEEWWGKQRNIHKRNQNQLISFIYTLPHYEKRT